MADAVNRISMNGNSALLSDLAREAGSSVRSAPVSSSLNVIPVTVINAPAEGQARSSSGVKRTQSSSGVKRTQEREEVKVNSTRVESDEDFLNLEKTEEGIIISAELCNDRDIAQWNMSPFTQLRLLQVSYHCFSYFKAWRVAGLPALEVLEVGDKCFTQCSEPPSYAQNYSFEVVDCPQLRSIRVGNNCFVEWGKCVMESVAWGDKVRNRAARVKGSLHWRRVFRAMQGCVFAEFGVMGECDG